MKIVKTTRKSERNPEDRLPFFRELALEKYFELCWFFFGK